ncbi:glycosyltransferase family 2 protein [Chryseobacterium sp.]|uniref:glycosyltransferase family 2 protein n=1 Tax=Chryseobacterium sp. TaxID=1871047 RepID=UPI0011C8A419|nr:glycosyltransferase family 2 protein [Chryseobacterium sp.]TXF77531.1 glycosyltransferase family 2 protein [Chryseobacterium sp.]
MPLVSVVVTTFNRKELLAQTLKSILNQSFQDFELIVVDNYSNYDFISHINSFESPKIRPFQNGNNGVIAVNRNYGIKQATGQYIAFCDDDDIWLPNKLEKQLEAISGSPDKDANHLVYSEVILFGEHIIKKPSENRAAENLNDLIRSNKIALSSTLVTHSNLIEFDEDPVVTAAEDYGLWLKLVKNGYKLTYLSEPQIEYRVCANSVLRSHTYNMHLKVSYVLLRLVLTYGVSDINLFRYVYTICLELIKFLIKKSTEKVGSNG